MQKLNLKFWLLRIKIFALYLAIFFYNASVLSFIVKSRASGTPLGSLYIISFLLVLLISIFVAYSVYLYYFRQYKLPLLAKKLLDQQTWLKEMLHQRENIAWAVSEKLLPPFRLIHGYSSILLDGTFGSVGVDGGAVITQTRRTVEKIGSFVDGLFSEPSIEDEARFIPSVAPHDLVKQKNGSNSIGYKTILFIILFISAILVIFIQILSAITPASIFLNAIKALIVICSSFFILNETRYAGGSKMQSDKIANSFKAILKQLTSMQKEKALAISWVKNELPKVSNEIKTNTIVLVQNPRYEFSIDASNSIKKILEANDQLVNEIPNLVSSLESPATYTA